MKIKLPDRLKFGKKGSDQTIFQQQDIRSNGKTGVILAELGMPEGYDFRFYDRYMRHVFHYSLPGFIRPIVLADRGIALIDPDNPLAKTAFKPKQLIDAYGSFTNRSGIPYVMCKTKWRNPGTPKNPWDHGYFLYTAEGKGGAPEITQKTGAKVKGWYFDRLIPEGKVAWAYQHRLIYEESVSRLKQLFPCISVVQAHYSFEESLLAAVEALLKQGCRTIVYQCYSNPVYSDFEEYATTFPLLKSLVDGRAKLIFADQIGNQPHLAQGFARRLMDLLTEIPSQADISLILSTHGHPFKKDTMDTRAPLYRQQIERAVRQVMTARKSRWELTWSHDEYADSYWDKKNAKLQTSDAYLQAIDNGFDFAIELPTEFFAESTDTMILHAMKKFHVFNNYDINETISYTDWSRPLVRRFRQGNTTGLYAGCLVGPYRKHVVDAVISSLSQVLRSD